jgi:hypothetical protein
MKILCSEKLIFSGAGSGGNWKGFWTLRCLDLRQAMYMCLICGNITLSDSFLSLKYLDESNLISISMTRQLMEILNARLHINVTVHIIILVVCWCISFEFRQHNHNWATYGSIKKPPFRSLSSLFPLILKSVNVSTPSEITRPAGRKNRRSS